MLVSRLAHRGISLVTLTAFGLSLAAPMRAAADGEAQPAESFTFDETRIETSEGARANERKQSLKTRTAPISSSGAFMHAIEIDVPPGRLGMTPALALQYSSDGAKRTSPVGAGWTLSVPRISRSSRAGFPSTKLTSTGLAYDDDRAIFEGPAGPMVRARNVVTPPDAHGVIYVPVRETEPVRFEYLSQGAGAWVEHLPSGRKRYYGWSAADARAARIVNELGTHAWLLVEERDAHGNLISYDYHGLDDAGRGQARAELLVPQRDPVVKAIEWGAGPGTGHVFRLETTLLTDQALLADHFQLDMLNGHVATDAAIESIAVRRIGDSVPYWTYTLAYERSAFTARLLLRRVTRRAPGEPEAARREFAFDYTGRALSFADPEDLTSDGGFAGLPNDPLSWVYSQRKYRCSTPGDCYANNVEFMTREEAQSPDWLRSGTQFADIDGNGRTDIVYHPSGLNTPAAVVMLSRSYVQDSERAFVRASSSTHEQPFNMPPNVAFTSLADVDGDFDLDAVQLPYYVDQRSSQDPGTLTPDSDVSDLCRSPELWNACGHIDPVPWPGFKGSPYAFGNDALPPFDGGPGDPLPTFQGVPTQGAPLPSGDLGCIDFVDACLAHSGSAAGESMVELGVPRPDEGFKDVLTDPAATRVMWAIAMRNQHVDSDLPLASKTDLHHWPVDVEKHLVLSTKTTFGAHNVVSASVERDFLAPLTDINADGRADLVLLKYMNNPGGRLLGSYHFVPRVYRSVLESPRDHAWRYEYANDTGDGVTAFTDSLVDIVGAADSREFGSPFGGVCSSHAKYPARANWNSFLLDVNSDGLPDLVMAKPPADTGDDEPTCLDGHVVAVNRGYRWDKPEWRETTAPGETWTSPPSETYASHPLLRVRNRSNRCKVQLPLGMSYRVETGDPTAPPQGHFGFIPGYSIPPTATGDQATDGHVPMGAMALADLNSDGRTDVVIAYSVYRQQDGDVIILGEREEAYLNTGRGFTPTPSPLPADFRGFSAHTLVSLTRYDAGFLGDLGRLVDFDNDGLVDLLTPGMPLGLGQLGVSGVPPRLRRGVGEVPDLLKRVDTLDGQETSVTYLAATSDEAFRTGVITGSGGRLPAGLMVAREIQTTRLAEEQAGLPAHPVQTIRVSYADFVRDTASTEAIGFAKTTATFSNAAPGGGALEDVHVVTEYNVERCPAALGACVVPYPLKGRSVRERVSSSLHVCEDQGSQQTDYAYRLDPLGDAVRIRSLATASTTCGPSACAAPVAQDCRESACSALDCRTTVTRTSELEPVFGYPAVIERGNAGSTGSGFAVAEDADRTVEATTYVHLTQAWVLGLADVVTVSGFARTVDGVELADAVLRKTDRDYDEHGDLVALREHNAHAPGCSAADRMTEYTYLPSGLREHETLVGSGKRVSTTYDSAELYPRTKSVIVTHHASGESPSTTELASYEEHDLRTGQTTLVRDLNGFTTTTSYDSFGRPLVGHGADGGLLFEHAYDDVGHHAVTSYDYASDTAVLVRGSHRTHDGLVLAEWEHDGTGALAWALDPTAAAVRRTVLLHDAFGRAVRSYRPAFVEHSGETVLELDTLYDESAYDGFDRLTLHVRADGAQTHTRYGSGFHVETNPRGIVTERIFNARDELVEIRTYDPASASREAVYRYTRNGTGALVRIVDPDGASRELAYDGVGRLHQATLPHRDAVPTGVFTYCYDDNDTLVAHTTPAGRTMSAATDELGRVYALTGTYADETVTYTSTYDRDGGAAKGRLRSAEDATGRWEYEYDAYGRNSVVSYTPSTLITTRGGATHYRTQLDYDRRGNVLELTLRSGAHSAAPVLRYRYQRNSFGYADVVSSTGMTSSGPIDEVVIAQGARYDALARLRAVQLGNGTTSRWTYDETTSYLTDTDHLDASGEAFLQLAYAGYDLHGNVGDERRIDALGTLVSHKTHLYDFLDRLERTTHSSTWLAELHDAANTYSPAGNLRAVGDELYEYEVPTLAHAVTMVTSDGAWTRELGYDADGYLTSDAYMGPSAPRATDRAYAADALGCMSAIVDTGAAGVVHRVYNVCNASGKRVFRWSAGTTSTESVLTLPHGIELRLDEDVVVAHVGLHQTASLEEHRALSTGERLNTSGYVHTDLRGSVLAKTSFEPAGPLTPVVFEASAEYDAWGAELETTEAPLPTYSYVAHEREGDIGVFYFGARVYDPTLRRWTGMDPYILRAPGAHDASPFELNLASYARNNPINMVDTTGLEGESMWDRFVAWVASLVGAGDKAKSAAERMQSRLDEQLQQIEGFENETGVDAARNEVIKESADAAVGAFVETAGIASSFAVGAAVGASAKAAAGLARTATVTFGRNANQVQHAFRHIDKMGLARRDVQAAIERHLPAVAERIPAGRPLNQIIEVAGQRIQYSAYRLPDGSINVGRIHGVP